VSTLVVQEDARKQNRKEEGTDLKDIYSRRSAHFVYKRPDNKYFRFCGPHCLPQRLNSTVAKAAIDNSQTNGRDCVPIKLYGKRRLQVRFDPQAVIY
jgi:hypothetical protein